MRRGLALALALAASGCLSTHTTSATSPDAQVASRLEAKALQGDDVDVRAQLASSYLSLSAWPGSAEAERLDNARKALRNADRAIELDPSRVEGHYYRAVAIGRVLEHSTLPDLALVGELEASGIRARELDPAFDQAGPLRLLALLYWQAPAWPVGPEPAGDHEAIDALFQEAVTLAPGSVENQLCYAEYLHKQDHDREAGEHLHRARTLLQSDTLLPPRERPELRQRIDALARTLSPAN